MDKPRHEKPAPKPGPEASAELMPVKCAVCGEWMDVKPGHINFISHGICPACYEKALRKLGRDG
jgi:hypothetical protein